MIKILNANELKTYIKNKAISKETENELNEICCKIEKGEKIIVKLIETNGKEVLKVYVYDKILYRFYLLIKITMYI